MHKIIRAMDNRASTNEKTDKMDKLSAFTHLMIGLLFSQITPEAPAYPQ
jgi:hypothetical protein